MSEKQLPAFKAEKGKKLALPLEFKVGEKRAFVVDTSKIDTEGHIVFKGNNLLLTCTRAGRVIGRIAVDWEKGPSFAGGDSNKLYVSTTYRGEPISVYAEALGEGAVLTGAEYII